MLVSHASSSLNNDASQSSTLIQTETPQQLLDGLAQTSNTLIYKYLQN